MCYVNNNLSNGSVLANFSCMKYNEANLCNGYNYANGRFCFNYRGAKSKITDYVFGDGLGTGNAVAKLSDLVKKDDLTPDFTKVGSGYGLEAYHAAIGRLHILRLAGNVTSSFSNFDLVLPDSCNGYFISEFGKIGEISYTIEINSRHLKITPSTSISAGKYFIHWLIYYGE